MIFWEISCGNLGEKERCGVFFTNGDWNRCLSQDTNSMYRYLTCTEWDSLIHGKNISPRSPSVNQNNLGLKGLLEVLYPSLVLKVGLTSNINMEPLLHRVCNRGHFWSFIMSYWDIFTGLGAWSFSLWWGCVQQESVITLLKHQGPEENWYGWDRKAEKKKSEREREWKPSHRESWLRKSQEKTKRSTKNREIVLHFLMQTFVLIFSTLISAAHKCTKTNSSGL